MSTHSNVFEPPEGSLTTGHWPALLPLVLSSPHSGTRYHDRFEDFALVGQTELSALQDGPVDKLLSFARDIGVPLVHAQYARAVVDLNRSPQESLPFLIERSDTRSVRVTTRSRSGLGVVPTRIGNRAIYDRALPSGELKWRIDTLHAGYHAHLETVHRHLASCHGACLLIDFHSMPDNVARVQGREIDIAIGTCHGQSCRLELAQFAAKLLKGLGLRVELNQPYSGGYVTEFHGRPSRGRPAMQIELRRSLFMDARQRMLPRGEHLAVSLKALCIGLGKHVASTATMDAA